jgi:hypothetical protein
MSMKTARWCLLVLVSALSACASGHEVAPASSGLGAPPLKDVDAIAQKGGTGVAPKPGSPEDVATLNAAATNPPIVGSPIAIGVAMVPELPIEGATAVVVRRVNQWPHEVILMTPAGATSGVFAAAMSAIGIEHRRNGDVPKNASMIRVTGKSMPAKWVGTFQGGLMEADFAALTHASVQRVDGVGDVPAVVVHMVPTHP